MQLERADCITFPWIPTLPVPRGLARKRKFSKNNSKITCSSCFLCSKTLAFTSLLLHTMVRTIPIFSPLWSCVSPPSLPWLPPQLMCLLVMLLALGPLPRVVLLQSVPVQRPPFLQQAGQLMHMVVMFLALGPLGRVVLLSMWTAMSSPHTQPPQLLQILHPPHPFHKRTCHHYRLFENGLEHKQSSPTISDLSNQLHHDKKHAIYVFA